MSIKPNYQTYRYTGEICRLNSQSIVECRLPGSEIGSILAVQANAVPVESVCSNGDVRYEGKLVICVVYEDSNRKICRIERGAEFFHKAENELVTPACFAKTALSAINVTHRREGSGLYVSVIVSADVCVYGGKYIEYLSGGEEIIVKKQPIALCHTLCVSGETEGEDEFETDYVGDVLLHGENAIVHNVQVRAGQIDIEGEMRLHACVLKPSDSLCTYERIIPFSMQIPCEEAFGNVTASARVSVKSAHLTVGADEEKGKATMILSYCLLADCFLHEKTELTVVCDAFSKSVALQTEMRSGEGRYLIEQRKQTEHVHGKAHLSGDVDEEFTLSASVLPRVELSCKKADNGWEVEGVVLAEILLSGKEGGYKSSTLSLPFTFPVQSKGERVEVDAIVCGVKVRRSGKDVEAEATVKLHVRGYDVCGYSYIGETVEGEGYPQNDAAMSIFVPTVGEDLWQVAKRLRCSPEELQKSNPDLSFPVKEGERIYVYRQIK